ncbi:thiamine-phosphate kinase [Novosphingobium sp.]|uniref:thiamine-phosphate kinase n=1 Tax=Novosphingobium sp. TaxID=1874826 RepID=UPI001E199C44|nr:thiamine-phosphate kinase [Novosphingobium sp.]MBX9662268.1 thiamine-phosphate kinase [Novosphingobium sp.]
MSGEAAFIAALRGLASHPAARGLADDCAVLELGGETLILTHDMMVEGVHWLPGQDPADVAWKLLATNLSDLASKGAEPIGVLLGYSLAEDNTRFAAGLSAALTHFNVPLLGGDTVRNPGPQTLGLTALGRATHRPVPSRSGAKAGDGIWITGPVGAAMLGFEALSAGNTSADTSADTSAYRRPVPRLAEGRMLAPLVTAMMDVSDGLLLDARRMAEASAATFALDPGAIPFPAALSAERKRDALGWGDDYELLFTLPAGMRPPCPAHRIGTVLPRADAPLLLGGAAPEGPLGYEHC